MAEFSVALAITLDDAHEGGYQCLRNDSGNWTGGKIGVGELKGTKYGISAAEFPAVDIQNLTPEQAGAIYKEKHYWPDIYDQIKEQIIADKLFDIGVLFGQGTAVLILQKVLQPHFNVVPDQVFGPATLSAVNDSEPMSLLAAYKTALVTHAVQIGAVNPNDRVFVADWIRRINS
jgi:lysozyme family protein